MISDSTDETDEHARLTQGTKTQPTYCSIADNQTACIHQNDLSDEKCLIAHNYSSTHS